MSNRVQYRRDTKARWAEVNPVLMEGEVGLEIDTKNIKMGDGVHAWNELEYGVGIENITSELGDSENLAASQKLIKKIIKDNPLITNRCSISIDKNKIKIGIGFFWLADKFGDLITKNIEEELTFTFSGDDFLIFNKDNNDFEVISFKNIGNYSNFVTLFEYDEKIGFNPCSQMFPYILNERIKKIEDFAILTPYTFYNENKETSLININLEEKKVEWKKGEYIFYGNRIIKDDSIHLNSGSSSIINSTNAPISYAFYLFFSTNDFNFYLVCYKDLNNFYKEGLILLGAGTFDNPNSTFISLGIISINEIVYIPKSLAEKNKDNKLSGLKISFLGDSITTFKGYLASDDENYDGENYDYWYPAGDVTSVNDTWWKKLCDNNNMIIVNNASWSDSECQGNNSSNSARAGFSDRRILDLSKDGVTPDIIICYIGVNDWGHGKELGIFDYKSDLPEGKDNIANFSDAYVLMLNKITKMYKKSKIFCCTLLNTGYQTYDTYAPTPGTYPSINRNGVALYDFNETIKKICNSFGVYYIDMNKCGMNFNNFDEYSIGDKLHPNKKMMTLMSEFVKNQLNLFL